MNSKAKLRKERRETDRRIQTDGYMDNYNLKYLRQMSKKGEK
jgi:hypothetical protein